MDMTSLPDISRTEVDFYETSFFRPATSTSPIPQLPSPDLVREVSRAQGLKVAKFEHLNLVVKFGGPSRVRLEEAQALQAISRLFETEEVPVPELFGWRVDGGENFIYMSLIRGMTLGESWLLLTQEDKKSICAQLSQVVTALRRIQQQSSRPFIGSINEGRVQDIYFRAGHEAGPFQSVPTFNDWVQLAALPDVAVSQRTADPYRHLLPDACNIYFSHGDLNLWNIMISGPPGCRRVTGILDWEQAGWYPEYWEYCKLTIAGAYNHEWQEGGWADSIMAPYKEAWLAFSEYWMWRRP